MNCSFSPQISDSKDEPPAPHDHPVAPGETHGVADGRVPDATDETLADEDLAAA